MRLRQLFLLGIASVVAIAWPAGTLGQPNGDGRSCVSGNVRFTYTSLGCGEAQLALVTYLRLGPNGNGWRTTPTDRGIYKCRGNQFAGICTRTGRFAGRVTWASPTQPCSFAGLNIAFFGRISCTQPRIVLTRYFRTGGDYPVAGSSERVVLVANGPWYCKGDQYSGRCESRNGVFAWSA
jgi:hypothetical protein